MFGIEFFQSLVFTFGYFGVFFAAFLGSVPLFLYTPALLVVFFAGAMLDPLLVGLVAGIGAAIGELVGYGIGVGGKKIYKHEKKIDPKWLKKGTKWFNRYGGFVLTFVFAATPLPDDLIGIIAGFVKYDIKKYFIACLLGKLILCLSIAYAGFYGISFVLSII